jgi:hypothetical protein
VTSRMHASSSRGSDVGGRLKVTKPINGSSTEKAFVPQAADIGDLVHVTDRRKVTTSAESRPRGESEIYGVEPSGILWTA